MVGVGGGWVVMGQERNPEASGNYETAWPISTKTHNIASIFQRIFLAMLQVYEQYQYS